MNNKLNNNYLRKKMKKVIQILIKINKNQKIKMRAFKASPLQFKQMLVIKITKYKVMKISSKMEILKII